MPKKITSRSFPSFFCHDEHLHVGIPDTTDTHSLPDGLPCALWDITPFPPRVFSQCFSLMFEPACCRFPLYFPSTTAVCQPDYLGYVFGFASWRQLPWIITSHFVDYCVWTLLLWPPVWWITVLWPLLPCTPLLDCLNCALYRPCVPLIKSHSKEFYLASCIWVPFCCPCHYRVSG